MYDATINANTPTTNYGSAYYLAVGSRTGSDNWSSLMRFQISELADKNFTSAELELFQYYAPQCAARQMDVRNLDSSFDASTVTWNTRPSVGAIFGSASFNSGATGCDPGDIRVDVSPILAQWESNAPYGLRLEAPGLTTNTQYEKRFCSMDWDSTTTYCKQPSISGNIPDHTPRLLVRYDMQADVGNLPFMGTQDFTLSDKTSASVNLKTGNLLVSSSDYKATAPGVSANANRYYNSLSTRTSPYFGNWTYGAGLDVGVKVTDQNVGGHTAKYLDYYGPNGFNVRSFYHPASEPSCPATDPCFTNPSGINAGITSDGANGAGPFTIKYFQSREVLKFGKADTALGSGGGWITSDKDNSGIGTTTSYSGNVTTTTDAAGRQTTLNTGGTAATRTATLTIDDNRHWDYTVTSGRLTAVQSPVTTQTAETYEYDSTGRLIAINTPFVSGETPHRTQFTYDSDGRIASVERGTVENAVFVSYAKTTFSYHLGADATVDKTTVTDPNGYRGYDPDGSGPAPTSTPVAADHQTVYTLDLRGRITKTTDALGQDRDETWDASNNIRSNTSGYATDNTAGNQATADYDGINFTGATLPTGAATKAGYSSNAGSSGIACPGASSASSYDAQCTQDTMGNRTDLRYTSSGNLATTTSDADSNGNNGIVTSTATYQGDPIPGQTNIVDCGGFTGQLCSAKDGRGNTTTYHYDADGNQTLVTPPAPLGATSSAFDTVGRLTSVTDGNNDTTTYTYDNLDRVLTTTYDSGETVTNIWNGDGTLKKMTSSSPAWTEQFAYNALGQETGRWINVSLPVLANRTVAQDFDAVGNLRSYTDSTGTTRYTYDAINELKAVQLPGGTCDADPNVAPATGSGCIKMEYNESGKETKRLFPGGAYQRTTYDKSSRMTRTWAVTPGSTVPADVDISYSYAKNGADTGNVMTRTSKREQGIPAGSITTYGYDTRGRLSYAAERTAPSAAPQVRAVWQYTYDANGNRTAQTVTENTAGALGTGLSAGTTSYTYNAANELTSSTADTGTWSYDGAGNQTTDGLRAHTATYGTRGNIASIAGTSYTSVGQGNTDLVATGDGRSFLNTQLGTSGITKNGSTLAINRDADGNALGYTDTATGARYYYILDNLDSVVGLVSDTGTYQGGYSYTPYGETRFTGSNAAVTANPQRYISGQYEGNGLYKLGARIYDTTTGRFTQQDPTGQEANAYLYSGSDPVNRSDPSGEIDIPAILEAIIKIYNAVDHANDVISGVKAFFAPDTLRTLAALIDGIVFAAICTAGFVAALSLGPIGGFIVGAACTVVGNYVTEGLS